MRTLFSFATIAFALPLLAQTPAPAPTPKEATKEVAKEAPAPIVAVSPLPSSENWVTGSFEVGERFRSAVGGSLQTYRSVVDLNSGPKLIGADFTILDPKRRLFDRIRVRAHNWGDDPYEGVHLLVEKQKVYEFNMDFRKVAYFNNLPSFADPLLNKGIRVDEQSFDTRRTLGSFSLDVLPSAMISPYIAYDRDSSHGTGVSVLWTNSDEFAVPNTMRDSTDLYRGGIHFTREKFHVTLEEGGSTFRNDQNTFTATSLAPNPGNNSSPILGQTQGLSSLLQDYGVRGNSTYSKAIVTATPFQWIDIFGHFLFSEPKNHVNYFQNDADSFVLLSQALLYNSELYLVTAAANMPHTSADVGVEIRPVSKLRILESWMTDRTHNSGSASQSDTLLGGGISTFIGAQLASSLAANYNRSETTAIYELKPNLTVRAGYRYIWGNGSDAVVPAEGLLGVHQESIGTHVGLGAVTWKPIQKLSLTGEFEAGSSTGAYFRTSLYDYRKVRAMGRYQLRDTIHLSGDFMILSNSNPNAGADYKYLNHQESVSVMWNPAKKKVDFQGSYEHCGYHSRIGYLIPNLYVTTDSIYNENCHTVTGLARTTYKQLEVSAGGSVALSSGSRPTSYYQPMARASLKLTKSVSLFGEWRYYGLGEAFYMYESFRVHLFTTGLRYSR